jgi:four helix bundle protein
MNSYKDLIVWQKSLVLTKEIYRATELFPKSEIYGLTNQLRRASVSVMSNIAEGFSRRTFKEGQQFLSMAFGSTSEIEAQLILAYELSYIRSDYTAIIDLLTEVRKMLNSMIKRSKS